MATLSQKEISGTSFHGVTLLATPGELKKLFGEPQCSGDKNYMEWGCETDNGQFFTIYDWKLHREPEDNEVVKFHIGSVLPSVGFLAKAEIGKSLIKNK